jgi:hypothetical protein
MFSFLKIQPLHSDQILQHIIIISSIAKGMFRDLLILFVALSGFSQVGIATPIAFQQFLAKGNLKNKFSTFLTLVNAQFTDI